MPRDVALCQQELSFGEAEREAATKVYSRPDRMISAFRNLAFVFALTVAWIVVFDPSFLRALVSPC
jgi:hypothetical protein